VDWRYKKLIAEWEANGRKLCPTADDITIVELIARFWEHAETYYRKPDGTPTHEIASFRCAFKVLAALYGREPASTFGPKRLKVVQHAMLEGDIARSTINARVQRVRRLFKWGVGEELVPPEVLHGLQAVPGLKPGRTKARETEPVRPVPEAHIEVVKPHVSKQVAALIGLQILTAARPGELVIMRPVDIDTSGRVWIYTPRQHKNTWRQQARRIYIGKRGQAILGPFLAGRAVDAYVFDPHDARADLSEQAETHRRAGQSQTRRKSERTVGDRYTVDSYRRAIHRACEKADIPIWGPGRLRHSAATAIRREFGLEAAQVLCGHKKADVTQIYAEVNERKAIEIARAIG
jgi:integrase